MFKLRGARRTMIWLKADGGLFACILRQCIVVTGSITQRESRKMLGLTNPSGPLHSVKVSCHRFPLQLGTHPSVPFKCSDESPDEGSKGSSYCTVLHTARWSGAVLKGSRLPQAKELSSVWYQLTWKSPSSSLYWGLVHNENNPGCN